MNVWQLLRARWWIWRITHHTRRLMAGEHVETLNVPADVADSICQLAIEYEEPIWVQALLSMPRDED